MKDNNIPNKINPKLFDILDSVRNEISKIIIGQSKVIENVLVCILSDGHVLLEGVPGLAKTLLVKTVSNVFEADFQRVQFTPDLLPADIIGTLIFNPKESDFITKKGPVFTNILLADEINRSPAKVQSALLEAMMDRQVTIGDTSYPLPEPFWVLATQNPLEQEGTYRLPEAQLDRFMMKIIVNYPEHDEELSILKMHSLEESKGTKLNKILSPKELLELQKVVQGIYIDDKVLDYIVRLVSATRKPQDFGLEQYRSTIEIGASPRASLNLMKASKAYAFLNRRDFVLPSDIHVIAYEILRHRIILTFEAEANNITSENIITDLLQKIPTP